MLDDLGERASDYLPLERVFRFFVSEPEGTGLKPTLTPVSFGDRVLSFVPLCGEVSPPDF